MQFKTLNTISDWIVEIRERILLNQPELIGLFDTYAAEAIFGRSVIDEDINKLPKNAKILEVGAGSLMLSCQLAHEGYDVTALEPIGEGFSHFRVLQKMVLQTAAEKGVTVKLVNLVAEDLQLESTFDYAFSINVMEHVGNYALVLANVINALKMGGHYRFICPNYTFPVETHFNIPIIFNKSITEFFLSNSIKNFKFADDPIGLWASLNWISTKSVKKILFKNQNIKFDLGNILFEKMLIRTFTDQAFRNRRSASINLIIKVIVVLRIHKLTRFIPTNFQPVIDCTVGRLR